MPSGCISRMTSRMLRPCPMPGEERAVVDRPVLLGEVAEHRLERPAVVRRRSSAAPAARRAAPAAPRRRSPSRMPSRFCARRPRVEAAQHVVAAERDDHRVDVVASDQSIRASPPAVVSPETPPLITVTSGAPFAAQPGLEPRHEALGLGQSEALRSANRRRRGCAPRPPPGRRSASSASASARLRSARAAPYAGRPARSPRKGSYVVSRHRARGCGAHPHGQRRAGQHPARRHARGRARARRSASSARPARASRRS